MKTLNDFVRADTGSREAKLIVDLRKEARRQIIQLENLKLEYGLIRIINQIKLNAQIKWIKDFFNTTEGKNKR